MSNNVLAVVNGKEITEEIFAFTMAKFPPDRQEHFQTEEGRKELIDQIISWELVYNHAIEKGFESNRDYLFQLEEAKKAIMGQLVIQQVLSDISVDENEIKEYFEQNTEYFNEPEQVTARHILVDTEEKAINIWSEINKGLPFDEAARKYSSCPSSAQGGSLGSFGRGMMVPEFEEAAFDIAVGEVSAPVKTQFGYHLILVDAKHEPQSKSFDEVKDMIGGHLLQEKQNYSYMNFVDSLKAKYSIEYK